LMAAMSADSSDGGSAKLQHENLLSMMRTRQVFVPFACRPNVFLAGISDLPALWEACKVSPGGEQEYYLQIASSQWRAVPLAAMRARIPLMDLTALLVAYDLKILGSIFEMFPKIAVGRATVEEVGRLSKPARGRPARALCERILSLLDRRKDQLLHPYLDRDGYKVLHPDFWPSDETMHLSKQGDYILYSDDLVFRIECGRGRQDFRGFCSMDILHAMTLSGKITRPKFFEKIGTFAEWNVQIPHSDGDQIR